MKKVIPTESYRKGRMAISPPKQTISRISDVSVECRVIEVTPNQEMVRRKPRTKALLFAENDAELAKFARWVGSYFERTHLVYFQADKEDDDGEQASGGKRKSARD